MCYAQHLFVKIAILEKIIQHPDLARVCARIPLWFVRTVKPQRRLFLHMLVKFIGMLLTFDLKHLDAPF